jgi:hypothetical protein
MSKANKTTQAAAATPAPAPAPQEDQTNATPETSTGAPEEAGGDTAAPAPAPAPETGNDDAAAQAPAPAPAVNLDVVIAPVVTNTAAAPVVTETNDWPTVTGVAEVDRVLKNVPAAHQAGIHRLMAYMEEMAPKRPISAEAGALNQKALYNTIVNTINFEEQYFHEVFTAILRLFEANKDGVFHETHVWRFMESVALSKDDLTAFQRLLSLIQVLGPVKGREQAIKQFDFNKVLQYRLNDAGRQRLLTYFNI